MRHRRPGIVFIGPNPGAIAAMGDKYRIEKAAAKAKVSTVPGYLGVIEDQKHAVKIADEIGYPVMIKASAAGGGKGMAGSRIRHPEVAERPQVSPGPKPNPRSATTALFVEKFDHLIHPRHIEIQVLATTRQLIYLGER